MNSWLVGLNVCVCMYICMYVCMFSFHPVEQISIELVIVVATTLKTIRPALFSVQEDFHFTSVCRAEI